VGGGATAVLAGNADGAIFGWTEDDHFGWPPINEPWITFSDMALPRHASRYGKYYHLRLIFEIRIK
jgi:hypothetical protein